MDRKTLIAILLIILVFWLSNEFIWKNSKTPVEPTEETIPEENYPIDDSVRIVSLETEKIETDQSYPIEADTDIQDPVDDIRIENENMILYFSNRGAVLKSIILKDYFQTDKVTPVDLIPPGTQNLNLELVTIEGNLINLGARTFSYQVSENRDRVRFNTQINNNMIEKVFQLRSDNQMGMTVSFNGDTQITQYLSGFENGIADTEKYLKHKSRDYKVISMIGNELEKLTLSKLKESREFSGKVDWAAVKSKYFTLALVPSDLVNVNYLEAYDATGSPAITLTTQVNSTGFSHEYDLYFGPLVYDSIRNFHPGLENLVEMGPKIIQWISKIFLSFLKLLNRIIPSWGLCIVIFSILLKILLYPLTHKSFESSHKMQKIQPKLKELQAKYKNDPRTLNLEMKKLYQEHGVSPLGGCLPMLLQMPVLFALYPILRYSIDLRQASFLWLPDLSEPDGTMVLPIAMAVFMFIQQKLMAPSRKNAENMDEKQQAAMQSQKMMMYIMPVVMFFIFRSLASGLVLYWTVFSIISTVQQHFIKKSFSKE